MPRAVLVPGAAGGGVVVVVAAAVHVRPLKPKPGTLRRKRMLIQPPKIRLPTRLRKTRRSLSIPNIPSIPNMLRPTSRNPIIRVVSGSPMRMRPLILPLIPPRLRSFPAPSRLRKPPVNRNQNPLPRFPRKRLMSRPPSKNNAAKNGGTTVVKSGAMIAAKTVIAAKTGVDIWMSL